MKMYSLDDYKRAVVWETMIMRIVVIKNSDVYIADRPDLPGSPIVGYGKTSKEAIGDLIYNDMKSFNIEICDEN